MVEGPSIAAEAFAKSQVRFYYLVISCISSLDIINAHLSFFLFFF